MSLKEKLQSLNKSKNDTKIDWEKKKTDWQTEIDKTLNETKEWFQQYINSELFRVVEIEKSITEEYLGTYNVKQLEYEFGTFRLVFEPMGRNILGALGRIDIYLRGNKTDKYLLVLLETEDGTSKWFLSSFKDKTKRMEFNKTNMEKLIEDWIDQNTI